MRQARAAGIGSKSLRRACERPQRIVPVPAYLEGLARELLDGRLAELGREQRDGVENRVDRAARQQARAVCSEQARDLDPVAGRREAAQRVLRMVVRLEPASRLELHGAHLVLARRALGEGELAHRRAERVPARALPVHLDEQPSLRERVEDLTRRLDAERLAELGREPLERCHRGDEFLHLRRLVCEHLRRQIREQGPAGTAYALERIGALLGRSFAERLDREPHRRGPPACGAVERGCGRHVVVARAVGEQGGRLVHVEREVGAGDLEHLAPAAKPLYRKGQFRAGGEDEMQA